MRSHVEGLVQEIVFSDERKARDIATMVGKPYPTLLRELNPNDSEAKLGLSTACEIMKLTGNVEPLEFMAKEMGYNLVKKIQ